MILYGSRARNEATEDSDWDLLILLDKPKIEQHDYRYIYPLSICSIELGYRRNNQSNHIYKGRMETELVYTILQEC